MSIKTNRTMGRILLTGACVAALTVGSAVPAFAVDQSSTTSVTYSSSTAIPGTNGWGFEIPTAIAFGTDKTVTVDASVNLFNTTPGGTVDQITTLPAGGAKLYLASANGFKLQKAVDPLDPVDYEVAYTSPSGGTITTAKFDQVIKAKAAIATFNKTNPTATGVATRTGDAGEGGAHSDTLTFSYEDITGA